MFFFLILIKTCFIVTFYHAEPGAFVRSVGEYNHICLLTSSSVLFISSFKHK